MVQAWGHSNTAQGCIAAAAFARSVRRGNQHLSRACCVSDAAAPARDRVRRGATHAVLRGAASDFELCRFRCLTNSGSVLHQNSYRAADRFCLLRRWARKPDFDDQLSRRSVGVLSLIVLVHTRAAMEFFMNWGLRFDDFGAQSGRPVDHQKHVKCFGTFFDCDAGDEDLTAAQRTVNRVYPALSVIAFIVAVWNLVGTRAGVRKHVSCDFDDFKVYLVLNPRV